MKANYLQKNRLRNSYIKRIAILIAVFIVSGIIFNIFSTVLVTAVSPLWKAENVVSRSIRNSLGFFSSTHALIEENTNLKDELASLEARLSSMSLAQDQQAILTDMLGRKPKSNSVLAGVLTHPPQTPYDVIVVDAGTNENIHIGSEVSMPDGPVLGSVTEVMGYQSKVKLFSANSEKTNAILERHNVPVTLEGVGAGNFKISLPRDTEVVDGDRIISADVSARLLAVVDEVTLEPTDSFKEVLARSPANIFAIRFVFVTP